MEDTPSGIDQADYLMLGSYHVWLLGIPKVTEPLDFFQNYGGLQGYA